MDRIEQRDHTRQHSSRSNWVLIGFLAVAAFFLWTEHRAHLLGILPYLLFLACPHMHLFHHGHSCRIWMGVKAIPPADPDVYSNPAAQRVRQKAVIEN